MPASLNPSIKAEAALCIVLLGTLKLGMKVGDWHDQWLGREFSEAAAGKKGREREKESGAQRAFDYFTVCDQNKPRQTGRGSSALQFSARRQLRSVEMESDVIMKLDRAFFNMANFVPRAHGHMSKQSTHA